MSLLSQTQYLLHHIMQRRSSDHLNWKYKRYMPIETIVSSTAISMQTCSHVRYAKALDSKNNDRLKEGEELKKGIPTLGMWYLPIIPRLKHFFANPRDAELASWHEDKCKKDRLLRHQLMQCSGGKLIHIPEVWC